MLHSIQFVLFDFRWKLHNCKHFFNIQTYLLKPVALHVLDANILLLFYLLNRTKYHFLLSNIVRTTRMTVVDT